MSDPIKLLWPCDHAQVVNTCNFACHKARPGYKGSLANDLASYGGIGLPIVAEQNNGVVTVAGWDTTGYGNVVKVAYMAGRLVCQTAHLASIAVKAGDKVQAGYTLGIMGTTGNSTGVHTHWAMWLDGKNIDPLDPKNKIVMVNTVAELDGEIVPPPVEPPVVTPPFLGDRVRVAIDYKSVGLRTAPSVDGNNLLRRIDGTIPGLSYEFERLGEVEANGITWTRVVCYVASEYLEPV